MTIEKYIGRLVEVIYQSANGEITKRTVTVRSVANGLARVYDADKRAYRTMRLDGILAVLPAPGRRVS